MSDTLLQSTLRELRTLLSRPRLWLVFALVVGLFSLTGPFGTYERLPFHSRLGYWLSLHTGAWGCALVCVAFSDAALSRRIAHRMIRMLIGAIVAALPIGVVITAINTAVIKAPFDLSQFGENALVALPISIGFCVLAWLSLSSGEDANAARKHDADDMPASIAPTPPEATITPASVNRPDRPDRPALLDRLPVPKRGSLIRLEVQDHYVLAITDKGSELLLMRLGDAIVEAGTGQQIHRSHWVADRGVDSITRQTGTNPRLMLHTSDGQTLPVSRSHVAAVRTRWAGRLNR